MSLYERLSATHDGRRALAKARLRTQVIEGLREAVEACGGGEDEFRRCAGLSKRRLRRVSTERADIRVDELADWLYTAGFELEVTLVPAGQPRADVLERREVAAAMPQVAADEPAGDAAGRLAAALERWTAIGLNDTATIVLGDGTGITIGDVRQVLGERESALDRIDYVRYEVNRWNSREHYEKNAIREALGGRPGPAAARSSAASRDPSQRPRKPNRDRTRASMVARARDPPIRPPGRQDPNPARRDREAKAGRLDRGHQRTRACAAR